MRKTLLLPVWLLVLCVFNACKDKLPQNDVVLTAKETDNEEEEDEDGYDGAAERDRFEFEQIKDPALGYVPMDRMVKAVEYTENLKENRVRSRTAGALTWTERGPIFDLVGASGNSRGGSNRYTSGRTAAILIDTLNDATGNTVICGGIAGGLWKCTNFVSGAIPNWQPIDDRFDNMAISSICQDPSNASIMYFSTGEATSNADAVYGGGIWKSTNSGATWTKLATTTNFIRNFKITCDAAGNVYVAARPTTTPANQPFGLLRSKDGGASWQNITPSPLTSSNSICTDIEISTTGKLHASFGYGSTRVQHVYTADPANVTTTTWSTGAGIRIDNTVTAHRLELATQGDLLYGVTTNASDDVDSCYKSIDGGATWTKQNTTAFSTNILNGQGWYNLTLAINPSDPTQFIVGGLDAYRSSNSGVTIPTRMTYWVSNSPYVHADHHFMQWWNVGAQSRIVIGCDGGVFLSNDAGATFTDRNRNLAIKQFYAGDIHPDKGSSYLIAGAQDNGVHQLVNPGLSSSTEVTGGDGCFVHINQQNPQIQFGSYVYNQYRRSTDGGNTWSSINFSNSSGLFVNPWDYDDGQNVLYGSWGNTASPNNQIIVWPSANTATNAYLLTISALTRTSNSNATTFKVSPYTKDRLYIGSSRGKLVRLDNASTVTTANVASNVTDISSTSFPIANLSCVNVGSSDNYMVATFSNYGVSNVWYSTDGGASWTAIDGDLPDMPVRWAAFDPQHDDRLFLATEAGVYYTNSVNGASTSWTSDPGFPTVRTDMLKIRLSDNTIVAATHGRGLYTAVIPATPELRFTAPFFTATEASAGTIDCRGYTDYSINVSDIAAPTGDATVTYNIKAGNTATEGADFDFTTNGSFSAMSKQQTFTSGTTETKAITIRVYDDAAIEGPETFTISFAVSGSTDAFAGTANNYVVTINDNDFAPVATTVGTGTVGNTSYGNYVQPLRGSNAKSRSQFLYLASELTSAGFSPGNITSLALRVTSKASTIPYSGFTVSLKATTSTSLGNDFETGATPYFTGNYTSSVGVNTFNFSTPFVWDGTSNILVEFCYDNVAGSGTGDDNIAMTNTSPDVRGIWARVNTGTVAGCSLAAANTTIFNSVGTATYIRPDIILNGVRTNNPVETNLNATRTAYFGPSDDVPYYTASGNIIARITNMAGNNFGCTQVTIDRAGTGAVAFWNNVAGSYLMSKTFQIVPTTNNPSGQYQVMLYFTAAEKAGWEAATGNSWSNIKIIKVKSKISNYTPATPAPDGPNAVEIVTPTFGTFGADYTLTYTFSSGFSGFGAGIPGNNPLPVTLLNFEGKLDKTETLLQWSTSQEQNTKDFEIEKSTDGINYYKIGSVKAAGNSSTKKDYSLRDGKLSSINYYRLRTNDFDGRNTLSQVVTIRYNAPQNVWVVNNPFNDFLNLRFAKEAAQVKLQLVSISGAVVAEKIGTNVSGQIKWNLPANLTKGTYIVRAVVDGQNFTTKVVKQ